MGQTNDSVLNYVITETTAATSLDPLDADKTQNLPLTRMIYATPIEMDSHDRFSSLVLESFKFDQVTNSIKFVVKNGLKFSDGTEITTDDVAFAVARMAFQRPKFPVLEHIKGLSTWVKSNSPLRSYPSGISVSKNTVTIALVKEVTHPLFRFSLELFSIIPKKCVDLDSNKIICSSIPSSGRYVMAERSDAMISFVKRVEYSQFASPKKITFKYMPAPELASKAHLFNENTAVAGNEVMFSLKDIESLKRSGQLNFLPASRFAMLLINPENKPFDDIRCRQIFAQEFRNQYAEIVGDKSALEESLFTKILPGYLPKSALSFKLSAETVTTCKEKLSTAKIKWGYVDKERDTPFVQSIGQTVKALGIKTEPKIFSSKQELSEALIAGQINFMNLNSGFWALDPSGDLQMLFTPNLHPQLQHLSSDPKLQDLIKIVATHTDDVKAYEKVNSYLHDGAIFNVYSHVRRFYFSPCKTLLSEGQFGASAPAPWEIFK
ncbi:MAG: ABC transporter substrate-binding protein [Bdellovibrionales bacterium]